MADGTSPPTRFDAEAVAHIRRRLVANEQLDARTCLALLGELERSWEDLAKARLTFASRAATALAERLEVVAIYNHGGCPTCRDAEARAFLAKLRKIVERAGGTEQARLRPGGPRSGI